MRRLGWAGALAVGLLAGAQASSCGKAEPCARPLEECGGVCVDLVSDPRHCGACFRSCGGLTCAAGRCAADPGATCPGRTGGAFVTLEICGDALKAWVSAPAFVDEAAAILGGAARRVPDLDLLGGDDCDDQWSFHADAATAAFTDAAEAACDACPAAIQADLAGWLVRGRWCPSQARVVAVDRRP